jgi:predicted Zn-dependent protease
MTSPSAVAAPLVGNVASSLIEGGQRRAAEPIIEALRAEPAAASTAARIEGDLAFAAKDYPRALQCYRKALEGEEAQFDRAHFKAGCAAMMGEDARAALPLLREALRRCRDHAGHWTAIAGCYLKLGEWARARGALENALMLNPDLEAAVLNWRVFRAEIESVEPIFEDVDSGESAPRKPF